MAHQSRPSLPDTPPHTPTKQYHEPGSCPTTPPTLTLVLPPTPQATPLATSAFISRAPSPLNLPLLAAEPDEGADLESGLVVSPDEAPASPEPAPKSFLTRRQRRLAALLLSSAVLLLSLAYIVLSSSARTASFLPLPVDLSLFSASASPRIPFGAHRHRPSVPLAPQLPPLVLTPAQELAALVQHLASALDSNALPTSMDPGAPLDPELVLGFDTRGPDAETVQARVAEMVADTWAASPVVIFTEPSPRSRELLGVLAAYPLTPAPLIIDTDPKSRHDAHLLLPLISRLTQSELPLLLLGGEPVHDSIQRLHASGELRALLQQAGAVIASPERLRRRWMEISKDVF